MTDIRRRDIEIKRGEYKDKAYIPKQLRPKLTKKLRQQLTPAQKNIATRRQRIQRKKYPMRK